MLYKDNQRKICSSHGESMSVKKDWINTYNKYELDYYKKISVRLLKLVGTYFQVFKKKAVSMFLKQTV